MNEQEMQNQDNNNKETKKFNENVAKLYAILNYGKTDFKALTKTQVSSSGMADIIAELTEEREEKAAVEFKREMAALLDEQVEYDRFVRKSRKEMEDKIVAQQKVMNGKYAALFKKIDDIKQYRMDAENAMGNLTSSQEPIT